MKKHINFALLSTLAISILPNILISSSINSKTEESKGYPGQNIGIALFDRKNLKETDYENLINVYEPSFKPMGVMGLRKWMIKNPNSYKKVGVGILDVGHINFDAIVKPKNSNATYETYDDGEKDNYSYHATLVASLVGGISGINPDANLYSLGSINKKNEEGNWETISASEFKKRLDWAIEKDVRIFNFSFGYNFSSIDNFFKKYSNQKINKNQLLEGIESILSFEYSKLAEVMDEYSEKHKVIFVNSAGNNSDRFISTYKKLKELKNNETNPIIIEKIDEMLSKFSDKEYFLLQNTAQSFNAISVGCLNENKEIAHYSSPINRKKEPSKALVSAIGHFNFKWDKSQNTDYYQKLFESLNYSRTLQGTSCSSPIIAGLASLIISVYDYTIKWKIDAADIKNILVLNSIYAKDTYEIGAQMFNDTMEKREGILAKARSGYGMPNWVQIRKYLTKKSKNNKWILLTNKEETRRVSVEKTINTDEKFNIKHKSRFKFSLSWLDSPKNEHDVANLYAQTSNYDLFVRQMFENSSLEYESCSLYGNHEFIHRIHNSLNQNDSQLELSIKYLPDPYDKKIKNRELKIYYKEY